jgi:hypothetical protein
MARKKTRRSGRNVKKVELNKSEQEARAEAAEEEAKEEETAAAEEEVEETPATEAAPAEKEEEQEDVADEVAAESTDEDDDADDEPEAEEAADESDEDDDESSDDEDSGEEEVAADSDDDDDDDDDDWEEDEDDDDDYEYDDLVEDEEELAAAAEEQARYEAAPPSVGFGIGSFIGIVFGLIVLAYAFVTDNQLRDQISQLEGQLTKTPDQLSKESQQRLDDALNDWQTELKGEIEQLRETLGAAQSEVAAATKTDLTAAVNEGLSSMEERLKLMEAGSASTAKELNEKVVWMERLAQEIKSDTAQTKAENEKAVADIRKEVEARPDSNTVDSRIKAVLNEMTAAELKNLKAQIAKVEKESTQTAQSVAGLSALDKTLNEVSKAMKQEQAANKKQVQQLQEVISRLESDVKGYEAVPPGTIIPFSGSNVPEGWLLCDGRALDSLGLPQEKVDELNQTLGNSGSLPDLQGVSFNFKPESDEATKSLKIQYIIKY